MSEQLERAREALSGFRNFESERRFWRVAAEALMAIAENTAPIVYPPTTVTMNYWGDSDPEGECYIPLAQRTERSLAILRAVAGQVGVGVMPDSADFQDALVEAQEKEEDQ